MPGLIPMLDDMDEGEVTEDVVGLLLPSELSVEERSTWCLPDIPSLEFRFRYAQADDTLAQLRRLLRLRQNLRNQNAKHLSHAQKALTRTRGIFDSLRTRIVRATDRYSHARSAMLSLDPDQKLSPGWMKRFQQLGDRDVCGPGRDPEDTSEGQFRPSWIWLVPRLSSPLPPTTPPSSDPSATAKPVDNTATTEDPEQTDSMRAHWAKCQARAERYEEEVSLVLEEMGRTIQYLGWKRDWWLSLQSEREMSDSPPPAGVRRGLRAYAHRQANVYDSLARLFLNRWRKTFISRDLKPTWLPQFSTIAVLQDHPAPETHPNSADSGRKPPPPLLPLPRTNSASTSLANEGESDSDSDSDEIDGDDEESTFDEAEAMEYEFEDEITA
jgi:hypothetical protein